MSQLYLICFDIHNERRLRKISNELENFGERVQYSVFECYLSPQNLEKLQQRMEKLMDNNEDHIRYYHICNKDKNKIIVDGRGQGKITENNDYYLL